ncbi:MAG TPA: PmeII family type II restriction endonuclease [Blastocatellia bacterium]|nr:PmeII family type II restriction endonuclease [Blastocatellia bacterium]
MGARRPAGYELRWDQAARHDRERRKRPGHGPPGGRGGQDFWEFVSGDANLYREIIVPIDKEAKEKDENFKRAYNAKVNEMTEDFIQSFMTAHRIDWIKLVDFVSKRSTP